MKKVKVVIFQPQVLDVFRANMTKRGHQASFQQSVISKIACELFIFMKYMFLILMLHEKQLSFFGSLLAVFQFYGDIVDIHLCISLRYTT